MSDVSATQDACDRLWSSSDFLKATQTILFWGIVCQYLFYYAGLAPIAPLLICWPAILLCLAAVVEDRDIRIAPLAWFWMASMSGILLLGLAGFYKNGYGGTYLARWPFSFGLAAFLPLVGSLIDRQILYRAASILGIQTFLYVGVALVASLLGWNFSFFSVIPRTSILPEEYFLVTLWGGEVATGEVRPVAFTPYATYAGAVSCIYALLSLGEKRLWLRWCGFSGWLLLDIFSLARTAWIALICALGVVLLLRIPKRLVAATIGCGLLGGAILMPFLYSVGDDFFTRLEQMRPTSTEVRHNLRTIAYEEWRFGGRPLEGIGQSIPGGTVVADMPIGTHDTLNTNLMLRGVLGLGMIALPLLFSLVYGVVHQRTMTDSIAIASLGVLVLYTYSESFEGIIQYCWPVLLLVGSLLAPKNASVRHPTLLKT